MGHEADLLAALCREHLSPFIQKAFQICFPGTPYEHNWHIDAIAWKLVQVMQGDCTRLGLNVPPRHLKSFCVSVAFVAFVLGHDPTKKFIVASYGYDLAIELSNLTRQLMDSEWYKSLFPGTQLDPKKNTEYNFKTTKGGGRFATTVGGPVTGLGADIVIMDDLLKPEDALSDLKRTKTNNYVSTTLFSRLTKKKTGVMINVMQRLHPDDLTGHLMEKGTWDLLRLSAIATNQETIQTGANSNFVRQPGDILHPAREDHETLAKVRMDLGEIQFVAQYQQLPVLPGGNMIKLDWIKRYATLPPMHYFECAIQSWDPAVTASDTSCYSVCTTWLKRGNLYYLVDVYRAQIDYPDLEKKVFELYSTCTPEPKLVILENSHIGQALYAKGRKEKIIAFRTCTPKGTKVERAARQSAKFEAGRVYLPATAPWLGIYEKELLQFPNAKYDDQVDSTTQFLHAMEASIPGVTV